ncbi:MAG TPA: aldo/keto reductase, partial [Trichococcus flocculiformis]|nr:aldo/keto reductase [Trichococcus flocculiformis]
LGEDPAKRQEEIEALRLGVELGMTLIDTAEMYGDGKSERLVGEAIKGIRDQVYLVSKVYPHRASRNEILAACAESLRRLDTDHLDLYLLHWRGNVPLSQTIAGMEQLKAEGKIGRWGVSNFDIHDMQDLLSMEHGNQCQVNQVLYHLGSRGIEFDLLKWQREHNIPTMAYSPLAQGGRLREQLLESEEVQSIAKKHGVEALQIILAWCLIHPDVVAIPRSSNPDHTYLNAQAATIRLDDEDLKRLDARFPAPTFKTALDII